MDYLGRNIFQYCLLLFCIDVFHGINGNLANESLGYLEAADITQINNLNSNGSVSTYNIGPDIVLTDNVGVKTEFGYGRHITQSENYGEEGRFKDFEYDQTTEKPFAEVVWIANAEELYEEAFHKVKKTYYLQNTPSENKTSFGPFYGNSTNGTCKFGMWASQTVFATAETDVTIHFAMNRAEAGPFEVTFTSQEAVSEIRFLNGVKNTLITAIFLAKTAGSVTTNTELLNIVQIYVDKFCSAIDNITCCSNGIVEVPTNGVAFCNCTSGFFGNCCGNQCLQGTMILLPPNDSPICDCVFGWGGDSCQREHFSSYFATKMKYNKECQQKLTNHFNYRYLYEPDGDVIIDEIPNIANTLVQKFEISDGSSSYTNLRQETFYTSNGTSAFSMQIENVNDFLLVLELPASGTHSGIWEVKMVHDRLVSDVDDESKLSGNVVRDTCGVWYQIVQRFQSGDLNAPAMAEIFFAVGQAQYSKFPTSTSLETGKTTNLGITGTSNFTLFGELSGILIGYNLVVTNNGSQIAESELLDVMYCYADQACSSLPAIFECINGVVTLDGSIPNCECEEGWVGASCSYPC